MRRFSLFKRNGIYYIRLYNTKTGKYLTAKSSGKTDRDEAAVVAVDWLKNGIPEKVAETSRKADDVMTLDAAITSFRTLPLSNDDVSRLIDILKGRELIVSATVQSTTSSARFIDYMEAFWNYDTSPYIREKRLHGQRIGKMKAIDSTRHIKYWKLYFGEEKRLGEMTRADLRDFSLWLAEYKVLPKKKLKKAGSGKKQESSGSASSDKPKCLAAGSINKVILSGTLPLKWAAYHNEIPFDPGKGLMKFSGPARSRGILQEKEVKELFEVTWKEERAKIASMLSMTTGLRAGEVLALRLVDVGEDRLFINHSWSWAEGLKCTKTGKTRVVPLLPVVRDALLWLSESNPYGKDGFIFYGLNPEKPMDYHFLLDGLKEALYAIGISEEERAKRNIVFHSWRHYFASRMANKLAARTVQRATGHSTGAMLEHYAEHELEEDLGSLYSTADELFTKMVPFIAKSA